MAVGIYPVIRIVKSFRSDHLVINLHTRLKSTLYVTRTCQQHFINGQCECLQTCGLCIEKVLSETQSVQKSIPHYLNSSRSIGNFCNRRYYLGALHHGKIFKGSTISDEKNTRSKTPDLCNLFLLILSTYPLFSLKLSGYYGGQAIKEIIWQTL